MRAFTCAGRCAAKSGGAVWIEPRFSCVTALIFKGTVVGLARAINGSVKPATAMTEVMVRFENCAMMNVAPYF
jgi:hypothetical protein